MTKLFTHLRTCTSNHILVYASNFAVITKILKTNQRAPKYKVFPVYNTISYLQSNCTAILKDSKTFLPRNLSQNVHIHPDEAPNPTVVHTATQCGHIGPRALSAAAGLRARGDPAVGTVQWHQDGRRTALGGSFGCLHYYVSGW